MSTLAQTNAQSTANVEVCLQPHRRPAQKSLAAPQDRAMVKRIARIRVISFILLTPCVSFGQSEHLPADLVQELQPDGLNSPAVRRQEMRTWRSLPDAPSVHRTTRAEKFQTFVEEARSPLTFGTVGINAGLMRETDLGVTPKPRPNFIDLYRVVLIQKESSAFFGKICVSVAAQAGPTFLPFD
jgi:hypothetical protein